MFHTHTSKSENPGDLIPEPVLIFLIRKVLFES